MITPVKRPIFIMGNGRSGTTLFYNLLAGHRNAGWFSNYTEHFPGLPQFSFLHTLYQKPDLFKRYQKIKWFPRPIEGFSLWDMFHQVEDPAGSLPLTEQDVTDADFLVHRYIATILRYSSRKRFVNKNTRNTRRIRYLHTIFPDALFIHVIRDGRAVTNSSLNVNWWPHLHLWWAEGQTPLELQRAGMDPVLIAARMWKLEVERALQDRLSIPEKQYLEIRYEQLMQNPVKEMKRILDFCGLPWTPLFREHIENFDIQNRNYKWEEIFTPQQIKSIEKEIGHLLNEFGYV